jgi:hypothetical protein
MKYSLLDHFSVIEPDISLSLMDKTSVGSVKELCALFPFDFADDFGFESRLGSREAFCDFVLQIKRGSKGAEILAGQSSIASIADQLKEDPFWKKIAQLFAIWTNPEHFLSKMVTDFWLEFDWQGSSYNLTPNIFFDLKSVNQADRASQWQSIHKVLDIIYNTLFNISFPVEMAAMVQSCILNLPANARLHWIGFMVPRKTEAVRLNISGLNPESCFNYLHEINWPGEEDVIRDQVNLFSEKFDFIMYNINIGRDVLPYLGFELFLKEMRRPACSPKHIEAIDFLNTQSLLLNEKKEGLIRFCGRKTVSWFYPVLYLNGINHFKFVYKKNTPPELKGYFGTLIRNKTASQR